MRIAFVGLPLAALLLIRDGHEIVWAAVSGRGALGMRRLVRLLGRSRVAIAPDLAQVASAVSSLGPDLVVSWFWTRKVPRAFRRIAPLGAIGVHPSLLPRHRGPDPFFWAIDAGDDVTGVTAHLLDDEYDTGATLGRRALPIDPSWDAWKLARALDRPSLALLRETVLAYANGTPPVPETQDEALATLAPRPTEDDLELRWSWETSRILRRVRAAAPWPGAFTEIHDETVIVTRASGTELYPRALFPGEAIVRDDGVAIVRSGDGAIELLAGRLEHAEGDEELDAAGLSARVRSRGGSGR